MPTYCITINIGKDSYVVVKVEDGSVVDALQKAVGDPAKLLKESLLAENKNVEDWHLDIDDITVTGIWTD